MKVLKDDIDPFSVSFAKPRSRSSRAGLSNRRGFVLVLVLLLLVICGAILGQFSSKVVRLTGQSASAQLELQHRWAIVSIRRTFLGTAGALLETEAERERLARNQFDLTLGGTRYHITLEDENAKLPVHRMLSLRNIEQVKPIIRDVTSSSDLLNATWIGIPKDLREIFNEREEDVSHADSLRRLNRRGEKLTVWSGGEVDLSICSPEVLDSLWMFRFSKPAPAYLHELQSLHRKVGRDEFTAKSLGNSNEIEFFDSWLTPNSRCYSLWLEVEQSRGMGFTAVYVRSSSPSFADQHFGYHTP